MADMEKEIDGLDLDKNFSGEAETETVDNGTQETEGGEGDGDGAGGQVVETVAEGDGGDGEDGKQGSPGKSDGQFGVKGHTPKGVQERFNELSRSNREIKEENARLKRELEEIRKAMPKPPEKKKEDFASEEEWVSHLAKKQAMEIVEAERAKDREEAEIRDACNAYSGREGDARKLFADYDEVMSADVQLPGVDREAYLYVMKSPLGPMVNYTLRKVDAVRSQFMMTPDSGKLDFLKGVEGRLRELMSRTPEKAPNGNAGQGGDKPKAAIRQPQEVRHQVSRSPNPATCSMQEWMDFGD